MTMSAPVFGCIGPEDGLQPAPTSTAARAGTHARKNIPRLPMEPDMVTGFGSQVQPTWPSARPGGPIGVLRPNLDTLSSSNEAGISGVQIGPGATALTRMPRSTSDCERARVKDTIAPLVLE